MPAEGPQDPRSDLGCQSRASAHLGGNASRQVVIIAAAVWGWSTWQKSKSETGSIEVRWATWKERAVLLAALIVGTAVFGTV
ncbi:nicotinamide mononucleotide transporter, partial [Brevibacterium paucivorans]